MNRNGNQKVNSLRANRGGTRKSGQHRYMKVSKQDNALLLRPEYKGQPVTALIISGGQQVLSTTITTGVIAFTTPIEAALIPNFATRFAAFSEFRLIKAKARIASFSSTLPGLLNQWFSEDDTSTPTTAKAQNAMARRFPACDVQVNQLSYVPHDPAQQTWQLVSSGAATSIGNHKIFTNNPDYGASTVATQYLSLEYELTVQFRGFI